MLSKELIGSIFFKGRHLLSLEAKLEYQIDGYPRDIVFFEMREDMLPGENAVLRAMLTNIDIYNLIYGIEEMFNIEESIQKETFTAKKVTEIKRLGKYEKFTKSGDTTTKIFLGVKKNMNTSKAEEKEYSSRFYLNIKRNSRVLVLGMSKIEMQSMQERLKVFSRHIDTRLWMTQANIEKIKKKGGVMYANK